MHTLFQKLYPGFVNRDHEDAFRKQWQAVLPSHLLIGSILVFACEVTMILPTYVDEQGRHGFVCDLHDPRTLFFMKNVYYCLCAVILAVLAVLTQRAAFRRLDLELAFVGLAPTVLCTMPLSVWRSAKVCGKDPTAVWISKGEADFLEGEMLLVMIIETLIVASNFFVPTRACWLWALNVLPALSYVVAVVVIGSPISAKAAMSVVMVIIIASALTGIGAWRNERGAREKWVTQLQLQIKVAKQRRILSQLQAQIHAMKALMRTVCEVVFTAGSGLCVVGSNKRLDELLGPMQGRCLAEKMLDVGEVRERFQRVVDPLLMAPLRSGMQEAGEAPSVVLVPPVSFRMDDPQGEVCVGTASGDFEAEILVADTGMWHGKGEAAWRYLVGLKQMKMNYLNSMDLSMNEAADVPQSFSGLVAMESPSGLRMPDVPQSFSRSPTVPSERPSHADGCQTRSRHAEVEPGGGSGRSRSHSKAPSSVQSWAPSLATIDEMAFNSTPMRTIRFGLLHLFRTWHLAEPDTFKSVAEQGLALLEEQGELSALVPFSGGQCRRCHSLLRRCLEHCHVCRAVVPPQQKADDDVEGLWLGTKISQL